MIGGEENPEGIIFEMMGKDHSIGTINTRVALFQPFPHNPSKTRIFDIFSAQHRSFLVDMAPQTDRVTR